MLTLKEKFWKDGYIFKFDNGKYRMVWNDKLIDSHGYIPKGRMSEDLFDKESTSDAKVIEIFESNVDAGFLRELIEPYYEPIWKRSDYIFTVQELKECLGIPLSEELIIVGYKNLK